MRRAHGAALALLLLWFGAARGSAAEAAPSKKVFHDDLLDRLVGKWTLDREIRGTRAVDSVDAEWILNHQFLQVRMRDVAQPPAYEALVLIGYDEASRRYVIHWCDDYGGGYSSRGTGTRDGDSIHFVFPYPEGPFHNTFTFDAAHGTWTCRLESEAKDGTRKLFAIDRLRRSEAR